MTKPSTHRQSTAVCAARFASQVAKGASLRTRSTVAWFGLWVAASTFGCGTWTYLPASQLPQLTTARGDQIQVTDTDGDDVSISRSEVMEMRVEARDGWRFMRPRGAVTAMPVFYDDVEEAERRGWTRVTGFEQPVQLHIHDEWLSIRDEEHALTVPVSQVHHLAIEEFDTGKTVLLVAVPLAGLAVLALGYAMCCPTGPR